MGASSSCPAPSHIKARRPFSSGHIWMHFSQLSASSLTFASLKDHSWRCGIGLECFSCRLLHCCGHSAHTDGCSRGEGEQSHTLPWSAQVRESSIPTAPGKQHRSAAEESPARMRTIAPFIRGEELFQLRQQVALVPPAAGRDCCRRASKTECEGDARAPDGMGKHN